MAIRGPTLSRNSHPHRKQQPGVVSTNQSPGDFQIIGILFSCQTEGTRATQGIRYYSLSIETPREGCNDDT